MIRRGLWAGVALVVAAGIPASLTGAREPPSGPVAITATPVAQFRIGDETTEFGPLLFVGGLELKAETAGFGGYSGLRFAGDRFLAVSDTGTWLAGTVLRDKDGAPIAVGEASAGPLVTDDAGEVADKRQADAEGLEIVGNTAWIAFERNHRISRLRLKHDLVPAGELQTVHGRLARLDLPDNRGLEAIAIFPQGSPYTGALLAVSERALDESGNIRAFIFDGRRLHRFAIARSDEFDVTDADFLPGGDLLLLERRFSLLAGPGMRLRRIPAAELGAGLLARGTVLLAADGAYAIDNMEGLDVSVTAAGDTRVTLLSDDNFSPLQRTLLLEFLLLAP